MDPPEKFSSTAYRPVTFHVIMPDPKGHAWERARSTRDGLTQLLDERTGERVRVSVPWGRIAPAQMRVLQAAKPV
jgi:hypothetical protein